ncbi:Uncharacterized protein BM_BM13063 [Brugia malayi]|uniref:Bm13063 n=1 Tax=Brugia malayi TaxID=6279 RepID=A0A0J9XRU2_BRUMA|nr:Uncharacterized protein BM_BM13063 [Brugia malayi]CDP94017.1 Bm13063 [Brugia malayi]VIO88360.1 Uncharacterized protein BM_BM13063 [Brugia malayi]
MKRFSCKKIGFLTYCEGSSELHGVRKLTRRDAKTTKLWAFRKGKTAEKMEQRKKNI